MAREALNRLCRVLEPLPGVGCAGFRDTGRRLQVRLQPDVLHLPASIVWVAILNDVSLRNLIPNELAKGFGFFQSKPAARATGRCAVGPSRRCSHIVARRSLRDCGDPIQEKHMPLRFGEPAAEAYRWPCARHAERVLQA